MAHMIDKFGRVVRKMRISVTDRCNFRCQYCMPAENIPWLPRQEILSFEEMARLARIAVSLGVRKIRLTGGEPLARAELERLVAMLKEIPGLHNVSMTTNGYHLPKKAEALRRAGLDSVNISLDSLQPERFLELTRRDYFHRVMEGIAAAQEAGFNPVKINCVAMRGINDDEIASFLRWGEQNNLIVRFIEFMPLDGDRKWSRERVVTAEEILAKAEAELGPVRPVETPPSDPARLYTFGDGKARFGIIASVSRPFCGACDRIRLTADGKIRNCLFAVDELDLREAMRSGADDATLAELMKQAVWVKWAGHLINRKDFVQPERAMYAIGG